MKLSGIVALVAGMGMAVGVTNAMLVQPDTKGLKKEAIKAVQPAKDAKPVDAKPADAKPAAGQPDPAAMEAAWEAAMAKNEHHERFKQFVGTWDAAVKLYDNPTAPSDGKGTMVNALINDGRFLDQKFTGEIGGKPFTGGGVLGYNNVAKKYEGTWCDNMSTAIMFFTGSYDDATKTYVSTAEMEMPGMGKVTQRDVTKVIDADHHTFTMYHVMAGMPETKALEITYTRSKGAAASTGASVDKAMEDAKKKAAEAADKLKANPPKVK